MEELRLKIAICDDQEKDRQDLYQILLPRVPAKIDQYQSGDALLASGKKYDLIFLDIEMPGTNGMETAQKLRQAKRQDLLVFLTAYDRFMPDAFTVKAFRYLLKPLKEEAILAVVKEALAEIRAYQHIAVPTPDRGLASIPLAAISLIESLGDQSCLYAGGKKVISSKNLKYWEEQLGPEGFFRLSRQYLLALSHISSLTNKAVLLDQGQEVAIPRRKRKDLEASWLDYLRYHARPL